ncbi:alpha-ketoacid dehydrogenase subunit beta [Brachybacterium vulturis]|uniref:Alpha-ketoacid dehydrogenase subunit beta n=1 Tax=Brachybacterium vulturis TaxID=2017484 RepID=A0A291GJ45_9MICO|nr:alpha-ketoacid dehydrogenase subunit beta [Brachybacterium vulturis]ATG50217.1 alpha-ketoacid dehydrogenase subunit beta [Brachybacterium vulturis]
MSTREMTYSEAIREAMAQAMTADERVFLMGEDVGLYGGAFGVENDLIDRFGPERVRDTTISELGIVGMGVGAAITGMRPIVEIQFSDFTAQAMDQIANQAAKLHFMVGGQANVPLVIRAPGGSGTGAAAQHSQSLEAWFTCVPGIKVVMPSNARDAAELLLAALEDPNPVMVLEHKLLYKQTYEVPETFEVGRLGVGKIEREGTDLTIVATGVQVQRSLEAAGSLAQDGISAEVIDPRTLKPLDLPLIVDSVTRTGRALLVQESVRFGGFMGEIAASIVESSAFGHLQAPVKRLCGLDIPIPYNPELEKAAVPQVDDIVREAAALVKEW